MAHLFRRWTMILTAAGVFIIPLAHAAAAPITFYFAGSVGDSSV
jgi:hypothetical protein